MVFFPSDKLLDMAWAGTAGLVALVIRAPVGLKIALGTMLAALVCSYVFAAPIAKWLALAPEWRVPTSVIIGFTAYNILAGVSTLGIGWAREPWRTLQRFTFLAPFLRKDLKDDAVKPD